MDRIAFKSQWYDYLYCFLMLALLGFVAMIWLKSEMLFNLQKLFLFTSILGLMHQGVLYCASKFQVKMALITSITYSLVTFIMLRLCEEKLYSFLLYYDYLHAYKMVFIAMATSTGLLFCLSLRKNVKDNIEWKTLLRQSFFIGFFFLVLFLGTSDLFENKFDINRANRYYQSYEKLVLNQERYNQEFTKAASVVKMEEIKQIAYNEDVLLVLDTEGKVHFMSDAEWIEQDEVERWKDIEFISLSEKHIVGLTNKGIVLASGEGFFGQTDVNGMGHIEFAFAGDEKTYLITTGGEFVIIGKTVSESDEKFLQSIYDKSNI